MKNDSGNREKIVVHIEEELEDLIPGFLADKREDVQSISQALETGDIEKIMMIGHSMKGSGGGYGFDRISEIGKSIEDAAKENKLEMIKQSNEDLSDYLDRVEVVYK